MQKYHFIGAAGTGMNPLAQLLLAQGCDVSGSDRSLDQNLAPPVVRKLQKQGLRFCPQDGSGVTPDLQAVVVSSAIEDDNPEISAAKHLNIPLLHRAELLANLSQSANLIGITGTAGKTTVTGMVGWVLETLGADPTVVNGGALLNWRTSETVGNFRFGKSNCWVLELDESDRSFLRFKPKWSVITNISKDHFELDELRKMFASFAAQTTGETIMPLTAETDFKPVLTPDGTQFRLDGTLFNLNLPGMHNAENAWHCVRLCQKLGYGLQDISSALAQFKGIERRLERVGTAKGITVYDDYAHNPAKIMAAWKTLKARYKRVVTAWRPHGYAPLRLMHLELLETFRQIGTDKVPLFFLPAFFAGGTVNKTFDSDILTAELRSLGTNAYFAESFPTLTQELCKTLKAGDALLILGARDPELFHYAGDFLAELARC